MYIQQSLSQIKVITINRTQHLMLQYTPVSSHSTLVPFSCHKYVAKLIVVQLCCIWHIQTDFQCWPWPSDFEQLHYWLFIA